jgi:hypothetical protein
MVIFSRNDLIRINPALWGILILRPHESLPERLFLYLGVYVSPKFL